MRLGCPRPSQELNDHPALGRADGVVEIDASDKKTVSNIKGPPETRWHVLQTRSRPEKALARTLDAAGPFRGIEGRIEAWRTVTGLCFRLMPWGAPQAWKSTPASSNRWTRTSRGGSASSPSAHVFAQLGTAGCARQGRSLPLFDA
jgi:hypothetical protein